MPANAPRRPRFQFTLAGLFTAMLLLCVMIAAFGGLVRASTEPGSFENIVFITLSITAPVLMLIVWTTVQRVSAWLARRRK